MSNIVTAAFLNSCIAKTRSLRKFDKGMILNVSGVELPEWVEIHFSNTGDGTTTPGQYRKSPDRGKGLGTDGKPIRTSPYLAVNMWRRTA